MQFRGFPIFGVCFILFIFPHQNVRCDQRVITLEQSVTIALENNPGIRMAQKEVDKARAGVGEAWSVMLPSLDASANFSHAWEIQESVIPNFLKPMLEPLVPIIPELEQMPDFVKLSFGLENTFTYGLMLRQPIFLGGAGIAGIQLANAAKEASEHQFESQKQQLVYNTVDAFYSCLLTQELVRVQEQALEQAQANLDIVLKRYDVGSASGLDKMRASVEVANLKPQLIAVKNNRQAALTRLRTVLGLSDGSSIQVQGELSFQHDTFGEYAFEDLLIRAQENRPELWAMASQKRMASKGVAIARSEYLPKLFFQTDYSYLAMRNDTKFTQDDFNKGFTSALSLQIPLFHGFKRSRQYQRARLDYKIALDIEKQVADGIHAEVEIAFNAFREAKEKYLAAEESISMAEEALRLANLMYEEGASTQLDVLTSQLALTRARLNHVSALYEFQMARYNLRRVTGTLKGVL